MIVIRKSNNKNKNISDMVKKIKNSFDIELEDNNSYSYSIKIYNNKDDLEAICALLYNNNTKYEVIEE
jgi:hypothetical protein